MTENNHRQKEIIYEALFLLFLSVIFFASSSVFLDLPGLGDEESFLIHPVVSILKGTPPDHLSVGLFRHRVFTMICAWTGPISALLFFPSLSFFGCNIYVMRLTRIFYGFVIIIFLYYFAKRFFDKRTAKISAFLMATLPYYVFMYRHGYLDDGILPFFLLASLFCFYLFYKKERPGFLYLGALFCGLGVLSKLNFVWYLAALSISFLVFRIKIKAEKSQLLIALLIFLILCLPVALSTLAYSGNPEANIISIIKDNLFVTSCGHDNSSFFRNVTFNLCRLKIIFSNDAYAYAPVVREYQFINPLYFPLFLLSILFYVARFIFGKKEKCKRVNLLISIIIIVFLFKNFTISVLRIEHFTIVIPLAIIVVASFVNEFKGKKYSWIGYSIIITITFLNIKSLCRTYEILYKTDECRMYDWTHPSSSIYKLSNYLMDNGIYRPVSIVPELYANIKILTQGKVLPVRDFANTNWEFYIQQDRQYYITRLDHWYKKWFDDFRDLADKHGKSLAADEVFLRKDGTPDMMVFMLKDKSDENNPQTKP